MLEEILLDYLMRHTNGTDTMNTLDSLLLEIKGFGNTEIASIEKEVGEWLRGMGHCPICGETLDYGEGETQSVPYGDTTASQTETTVYCSGCGWEE